MESSIANHRAAKLPRVDWIDAAKAISILLVVFHHAQLVASSEHLSWDFLTRLDRLAQPIRMPLFFSLSGILAGSALALPWKQLLKRKVVFYYYLYVVWMTLFWLYCRYVQVELRQPEMGQSVGLLVSMLVLPRSGFWFLWMLAIFFTLGKLLDPWRGALALCVLVALALVAEMISVPLPLRAVRNIFLYAPFFLGGAWYGRQILPLIQRRPLLLLALGVLSYGVMMLWLRLGMADMPGTGFLLSIAGLLLAIGATWLLCRSETIRRALCYIGRNTLPIYVVHGVIINTAVAAMLGMSLQASLWIIPMLSVLAVAGSLLLRRLLGPFGARWLYSADGLHMALQSFRAALHTRGILARQS
ncbi:hypothetical protein C1T17_15135 [Sphingobium sp. SCG-1]|uniref:acyltransferase family protein n=1 Tax=Sphingobium sp. SCG-1 TaxID=2072936 RepID=UPI000CD6B93C|nr:acyltransferase family protein [Sphingobium sp. SCG-1]AUW59224.1 hypothetical protein C1T17_15135 [Sphingobium sp. SCG-1]